MNLYLVYRGNDLVYVSKNLRCAKDAMNNLGGKKIVEVEIPQKLVVESDYITFEIVGLYKKEPYGNDILFFGNVCLLE